jgi:hypothetical protein
MRERLFRWRCWFEDRFPNPRHRTAAAILLPLSVLCAAWIVYFTLGSLFTGSTGPRITPQIRHAQELTRKLHESGVYDNVTILPHIDYPDRLRVSGAVQSKADIESLMTRLTELDPAQNYVVEVQAP